MQYRCEFGVTIVRATTGEGGKVEAFEEADAGLEVSLPFVPSVGMLMSGLVPGATHTVESVTYSVLDDLFEVELHYDSDYESLEDMGNADWSDAETSKHLIFINEGVSQDFRAVCEAYRRAGWAVDILGGQEP